MTESITGWVARDRNDDLNLFEAVPERYNNGKQEFWLNKTGTTYHSIPASFFPDLKWSDDPIYVKQTITTETL